MTEMSPEGVKLFYSYAPEDKRFQKQIAKHLSIMERQRQIISWDYSKLAPGQNLAEEIKRKLNEADIILLLISHHFIASSECYDVEMKCAIERQRVDGVRVIPILLSPVIIEGTPFSSLNALPANNNPITNWSKPQNAFVDITKGIKDTLDEMNLYKSKIPFISESLPRSNITSDNILPSSTIQIPYLKKSAVRDISNKSIEVPPKNSLSYKKSHLPNYWKIALVGIIIAFLALFPYVTSHFSVEQYLPTANNEDVYSNPLEMSLETIHSQIWFIPGNVTQYSLNNLPQSIGVIYTDGHISAPFYYLYFSLHNSSQGHSNIIIEGINLLIQKVRIMPHPIAIWKNDIPDDRASKYKYEALYLGETQGSMQAEYVKSDYVTHSLSSLILPPGNEQDEIEIHIISRQEADIIFKIQIIYFFGNESEARIYNVNRLFEVVFVNKIDQRSYQLESGHFILAP